VILKRRFELPGPFRPLAFFLLVVEGGGREEEVRPAVDVGGGKGFGEGLLEDDGGGTEQTGERERTVSERVERERKKARNEPVCSSCASSSPTGVLSERHRSLNSAERGRKGEASGLGDH
jgi:hypothetical protein